MSLNKLAAINYNKSIGYSQKATAIIQTFVNARTTGVFDNQTVEMVYQMQQSPLYPRLKNGADGMVGPNTLGIMILELEHAFRKPEADVLRNYLHTFQTKQDGKDETKEGEINPVKSFMQWTVQPLALRTGEKSPGRPWFSVWGVFSVSVKFTSVNPFRYEYRQKIRGGAQSYTPGTGWIDLRDAFMVPSDKNYPLKGIHKTAWKEDGELIEGREPERFGYRKNAPKFGQGSCDYYATETEYFMQDTFGFQENTNYVSGAKISLNLDYKGCVVDMQKPTSNANDIFAHKEVFSKLWSYKCDVVLP